MKGRIVAVLLVIALAAVAPLAITEADELPAFGIRPARTAPNDPGLGAFFSYRLEAGTTISDEALVINMGDTPIGLKLYSADGITAINGGITFTAAGEQRRGIWSWLSAGVGEVMLEPGQRTAVPFTMQIPPDAGSGDHVAGWVVEAPPRAGDAALGVATVDRVGVAVVVRVPGPIREELAVSDICLNQETGSNYLQLSLANRGNVLARATGTLTLTRQDGEAVFSLPLSVGTVIPGDATFVRVDAPFDPGPGSYSASALLRQPNGAEVLTSSAIKIGDNKENGCRAVAVLPEVKPAAPPAAPERAGAGFPWWLVILLVLAALLAAAAARRYLRRRQGTGPPAQ